MPKVFWLYGRSGAGKTTLSERLERALRDRQVPCFLLDGDELRGGLCNDLGYGEEARTENHRRAAEVAKLIASRGIVVVAATMAPQYQQRDAVQSVLGDYASWIFIDAPFETCAERDPKGLYAKAKQGRINQFKDYPFDTPRTHEVNLHLQTAEAGVDQTYQRLLNFTLSELSNPEI